MPKYLQSKFFFQFTFAATASTLVSGALAERCNFIAYLVYCNLITGASILQYRSQRKEFKEEVDFVDT